VEAEAEDVVAREEPGGGAGPEGTRNPARRRQEKAASPPAGTRSQAASPRARAHKLCPAPEVLPRTSPLYSRVTVLAHTIFQE
jgi:hypothetical protein